MDLFTDVARQYAAFAEDAADSPCFRSWALAVAEDPEVQAWIGGLSAIKQQPNLVFAAARWHGVPAPGPYAALREALLDDDGALRATVLERSTQTNEVGRLATLVPAFALAAEGQPIALLEVGAGAGLTLCPDGWSYRWRTDAGDRVAGAGPELACRVRGEGPLPDAPPVVAWRGGVDLHPLDVTDDDAMAWLATLVWPEHEDRRVRLAEAVRVARRDPPRVVAGDLLETLPDLVARARHESDGARVVVFHSAVIAYLEPADRRRFHALATGLVAEGACRWVSNEGHQVLPEVTATGPDVPEGHRTFVLGLDGRALAWTHGHGRALRWV